MGFHKNVEYEGSSLLGLFTNYPSKEDMRRPLKSRYYEDELKNHEIETLVSKGTIENKHWDFTLSQLEVKEN